MKKRDKKRENREILSALAMVTQIGLAMITCMGISLALGIYIDGRFGTKIWTIVMLIIGIMAAIRSLFILTGRITEKEDARKGASDEGSKEDTP